MGLTSSDRSTKGRLRSLEVNVGLIERVVDASLGTRGSATESANCSRRLEAPWDKAFRSSARSGLIPRQPTASSLMTGSVKRTCWPAISNRQPIVPPPLKVSVLVLHDTTEFSYQREKSGAIGITKSINSGRDKVGRLRSHGVCGILMHSSLAVTIEGAPLGLAAVKFWIRKKFKGTAALKRRSIRPAFPSRKSKASVVGKSQAVYVAVR